uniref:Guided entry of tail-anchored proteins factor 1 n=1 Tax=Fundulus heteroclitus TaxID=8078 RepID=A0A3Q2TDQ4_FUNHE
MATGCAWFLVLVSVFLCNLMKILLPTISSFLSKMVQKDADQESEMRSEIQQMKKEQSSISMMDEFARYARLERKINKTTDKLKTHVQSRTAQQAKMKWVVNIVFYVLQAALMVSLIWKYYSDPVTVVPSKWIAPVERLVAFPTGVAGSRSAVLGVADISSLIRCLYSLTFDWFSKCGRVSHDYMVQQNPPAGGTIVMSLFCKRWIR